MVSSGNACRVDPGKVRRLKAHEVLKSLDFVSVESWKSLEKASDIAIGIFLV